MTFCQTYVLKRYWRPIRVNNPELHPTEGELYERLDDGLDLEPKHAIAYHDIEIDGEIDSTLKLIRRNLVAQHYERRGKPLPAKRTKTDPEPSALLPEDRCHTNILMPMGESIRRFCNPLELLSYFPDCIREQKRGHDKLIIHRDASIGNLLIFERSNGTTFGRLMDYDHAKKAKEKIDITSYIRDLSSSELDTKRKVLQYNLAYVRQRKADNVVLGLNRQVDNEVLDRALKWVFEPGHAAKYIRDVADFTGLGNDASEKPLCLSDLGWDEKDGVDKWPDFANRKHGPGERTVDSPLMYIEQELIVSQGTLPYMSGDVIARKTLHIPHGFESRPPFVHQAIHDVESLFWVLVNLCLTRKGPGAEMRREELDNDSPSHTGLRKIVNELFESKNDETLKEAKISRHDYPELFGEEVVKYFHPYFEPLKPYVLK
ncbi:hypothetical protein C0995_013489, partial [Termitomyces sp. Mi166